MKGKLRASSVNAAILNLLTTKAPAHLTAGEIYEGIRSGLPAVNPSTVYRALERLARAGEISVSDIGSGAAVYEAVGSGRHHHLVCQKCGQTLTIGHEAVVGFFADLEKAHDFSIATNHLVLFGTCRNCRTADEEKGEQA